ncbi:MAG: hypothetical protein HN855_04380 [Anaerolineae bacterium]|jgi:hypothetical protein|nr:hypothetical protein [Anaerolineae bacterium]MBT7016643.1 hypothetical protein [Anaerolineae bacterium]MBT7324373.1 hypothetical protein [Anaerolineae bacterium]MBT7599979.1 hypothetical protein [Anaerolineae bacterium]
MFRDRLDVGEVCYLFKSVYLPVDSVVADENVVGQFSIAGIQNLGFLGWDVVGIVPRTIGVGLTNLSLGSTSGETWGAGLGGNVAGVYVLLKKSISSEYNVSDKFLQSYIVENIEKFATKTELEILSGILSGEIESAPTVNNDLGDFYFSEYQ